MSSFLPVDYIYYSVITCYPFPHAVREPCLETRAKTGLIRGVAEGWFSFFDNIDLLILYKERVNCRIGLIGCTFLLRRIHRLIYRLIDVGGSDIFLAYLESTVTGLPEIYRSCYDTFTV